MNVSPNVAAVLVALLFGVGVFPWTVTANKLGSQGVFLFVGGAYLTIGLVWVARVGFAHPLTLTALGVGLLTGVLYAGAVGCTTYAFTHPRVSVPVAAAITATYPLVTAIISVMVLGQRLTGWQVLFLATGTISVVGLALSGKR